MFGDININFRLSGKNYKLELGYNSTPQDFFERFLQLTSIDPDLYNFISEKQNILNSNTIVQAVSNPLSDFEFECQGKKDVQRTTILLKVNLENGQSKNIKLDINMITKEHLKSVIGLYFKIDPNEVHLKKISPNKYELTKVLFSFDANINGYKYTIIYSENASVLDIKYYASFTSGYSCSQFFINGIEYRNNLLFSSIVNFEGEKYFEKFLYQIFFRLEDEDQVQTAVLEGSAIGRNVKIAIANAIHQNASGMLEDYLAIDNNGVHIPVDIFSKFNINSITEGTPFVLGIPINLTLEIKMEEEDLEPIQKSFDPEITAKQLRKQISKLYQVDSPDFVTITDSSGYSPEDSEKLGNFASEGSTITITISSPQKVEPCFILYNSKSFKQISISVDETNASVLKQVAKSFKVDPESYCLWLDNVQLIGTDRFLKNYLSSATFKLAGKLKVEVNYQDIISTFAFPLDVEFDALSSICSYKYGKAKNSIGFYTKTHDSLFAVYQPWNGPLIPGPQYIARYRSSENKNIVKLIMKLNTEEIFKDSKVEVNVVIFENGNYVKDTLKASYSDKLSILFTQNVLANHQKGLHSHSTIFINDQICRSTKTVGEAFSLMKDLVIYVYPPGTFMYILPDEANDDDDDDDKKGEEDKDEGKDEKETKGEKVKYIVTDQNLTIGEFMKKIYKSSKEFVLYHNGQLITDTFQLVQFFDPQIPFKVVIEEDTFYNLTYKKVPEKKVRNDDDDDDDAEEEEEEKIYTTTMTVDNETTVHQLLVACCDLLKQKAGLKGIKATQIRVTINSTFLTKDMDNVKLKERFGQSCNAEIILLQKFCFTIQGENLLTFHFSPDDSIQFVKLIVLRRLQAKDEDMQYYYLLENKIAISEDDHLYDHMDDEDLCLDIVPIQCTVKVNFIFPEFTHEFVLSTDLIYYDIKEFFAKFYDIDDPDLIELVDTSNEEVIDENDNPTTGQVVQVNINAKKPKLNEKYSQKFAKPKTLSKGSEQKMISMNMNDNSVSFVCPFYYQNDFTELNLNVSNEITCLQAKNLIVEKLNASEDQGSVVLDPENILISINNEKIADSELLKPKYVAELGADQNSKFIIEINRSFEF